MASSSLKAPYRIKNSFLAITVSSSFPKLLRTPFSQTLVPHGKKMFFFVKPFPCQFVFSSCSLSTRHSIYQRKARFINFPCFDSSKLNPALQETAIYYFFHTTLAISSHVPNFPGCIRKTIDLKSVPQSLLSWLLYQSIVPFQKLLSQPSSFSRVLYFFKSLPPLKLLLQPNISSLTVSTTWSTVVQIPQALYLNPQLLFLL